MRSKEMEKIALWGTALILDFDFLIPGEHAQVKHVRYKKERGWSPTEVACNLPVISARKFDKSAKESQNSFIFHALAIRCGNAENNSPSETIEKEIFEKLANESLSEGTFDTIEQPAATEEVAGGVSQVAERRMSLYDFFFGNKNSNNNNNNQDRTEGYNPGVIPAQQQVQQQQNPNQVMFVRESTFPNPNGGLLSRLILARRMSRLQRLSNRLQILPSMFGLFQRQSNALQQRTLNQRIGGQYQPEYNPADILLDGVGFKNASITPHRQYSQARLNQNFANDASFSQNQGFFGINDIPNQPYPQTQTSAEQFERMHGNFGLRQNAASFDQHQQGRNKENVYNAQQAVLTQQQHPIQQQAAYDQGSQEKSYEQQQQQVNPQQKHYEQQQQQLKYQQGLQEHQAQLRQQQQQLYEQHLNHLRQQQLYDQQQQELKQQLEEYGKQKELMQKQQDTGENYEQKSNQQQLERQQLKLQQELLEQQNQLKNLLLDQQQQLKQQDERFQQLQKHVLDDQKPPANQKVSTQQARDSAYYTEGAGNVGHSGNTGVLDFGRPGTYDVGLEISSDPFKSQAHNYQQAGTVDGDIGSIDKTSYEKPIAIGNKPTQVVSSGWRLPLFPLGIFPRPQFNLNGKVFFGAELGRDAGLQSGGWK